MTMDALLETCNSPYVIIGCFIAAVLLILIDYFFPTDWPCHVGYFCFASGLFFALPWALLPSLMAAISAWGILAVLHQLFFRTILENATTPEEESNSQAAS